MARMSALPSERTDVVILGGALAGASTALLLRRRFPDLRVLILERNPAFDWKVGESTVETSGYFLSRVLKLYDHLSREQLPKQSFRYWFHNGRVKNLREASESGPYQLARLPAFQLDRAKLDEHVLSLAVREGAELWRPAKVVDVELAEETGAAENRVTVERGGETRELRCGWVVDASGRSAILARKRGWLHPVQSHPTSAIWARFRNVKDLDGSALEDDPDDPYSTSSVAARRLATNHYVGYGYWMWFIPLQGGETSIGAVWDRRLVQPAGSGAEERLRWFLDGNPLTRELLDQAELVPDDLRQYANLPYLVDRVAGRGWSLAGDAAGFLDPFYSPGIDQLSFSVAWTLELIKKSRMDAPPEEFANLLRTHNENYTRYLRFFYESIFRDKYYLMGDFDTMTASFLLDTGFYYFFTVWPIYNWKGTRGLLNPPFYHPFSKFVFPILRFYQRRLISIAQRKMKLGIYGNRNAGRRPRFPGFSLGLETLRMFLKGVRFWLRAEAANAWTYISRPRPMKVSMPGPLATPDAPSSIPTADPLPAPRETVPAPRPGP